MICIQNDIADRQKILSAGLKELQNDNQSINGQLWPNRCQLENSWEKEYLIYFSIYSKPNIKV